MKHRKPFHASIREVLDLPQDIDPHLVQVHWIGKQTVEIQQHRGIAGFEQKEIRFFSEQGMLVVCGEDMQMRQLTNATAWIDGSIHMIFFEA